MEQSLHKSKRPAVRVVHQSVGGFKGRLRLNVFGLYRSKPMEKGLTQELSLVDGIVSVTASHRTGNILVVYHAQQQSPNEIIERVSGLLFADKNIIQKENYKHRFSLEAAPPCITPLPWYSMSAQQALEILGVREESGLSQKQAAVNIQSYGKNVLPIVGQRTEFAVFCYQFNNLPVALLVGSAGLSILTGGFIDAFVIGAVVLINAYLGYVTESSANKTVSSLNHFKYPAVTVLRDNIATLVEVADIAIGDIILLHPGTYVPADARILKAENLQIDESILTGESLPVYKQSLPLKSEITALADRSNMVFRGTTVTAGSGRALVVAVSGATEIGAISDLMGASKQPDTPLQKRLEFLGKRMVGVSVGISGAVFLLSLVRRTSFVEALKTAVSLAVAAIPEGLPATATVTLATGIKRLARQKLLIRHLDAVETLGSVDVVCFDKTGTLTLNEMLVDSVQLPYQEPKSVHDLLGHASKSLEFSKLLEILVLCNEAKTSEDARLLSATERALLNLAVQSGIDITALRESLPRLRTQYRSDQKNYMFTVHQKPDHTVIVAAKGQPDELLKRCSFYLKDGQIIKLEDSAEIKQSNIVMANRALRVLGIAFKETSENSKDYDSDMVWLGLVGLLDPCRDGVKEVIKSLHDAGIRTAMITGDQTETAKATGRQININQEEELIAFDFARASKLPYDQFHVLLEKANVFSRVSPSQKLQIVKGLQRAGKIVAMIGDGINDGPALKVADVGIAMSGDQSSFARLVADLVVANNDLARIILGIEEGRTIHQNLKKAVDYIISQNMSEMVFTFASSLFGLGDPLTPMQLLWVNLVTDILPELALSQEPPEMDVLKRAPRSKAEIISARDLKGLFISSLLIAGTSVLAYGHGVRKYGIGPMAQSMGFVTLNSSSLLHTFSSRSGRYSILSRTKYPFNKYVPIAVGVGFLAQVLSVYSPFFRRFLKTRPLSFKDLFVSLAYSSAPFLIIESLKEIKRRSHINKSNMGVNHGTV